MNSTPLPQANRSRSRVPTLSALLLPLWLGACVTINVYFPAAEAAKAADQFIKDVYGSQPSDAGPKSEPGQSDQDKQSHRPPTHGGSQYPLAALVDFFLPRAHAQANIELTSPAIQAIKASMTARQAQLATHYDNGAVGITADGLITLRDPRAVALKERNVVMGLIEADNRDRNALYREVAQANGHPEWEQDIRSTFAKRWVANARAGWWYQDGGNWRRK